MGWSATVELPIIIVFVVFQTVLMVFMIITGRFLCIYLNLNFKIALLFRFFKFWV